MSEFKHRDYVINIFNPALNGTIPHADIIAKPMYHLIYSFLPGTKFKDISLSQACCIRKELVELWLTIHNTKKPNKLHFNEALYCGRIDVADYLFRNHLPPASCSVIDVLTTAIKSNRLPVIKYAEQLITKFQQYCAPMEFHQYRCKRSYHYFVREKLLMLKELRKTIGMSYLVPPGETDPETVISKNIYAIINVDNIPLQHLSYETFEHLIVSGFPIPNDFCHHSFLERVWYGHSTTLPILKYLYHKIPIPRDCDNTVVTFPCMSCVIIAMIEESNVESFQWCLDRLIFPDDILAHRQSIVEEIYSHDAVDILRLLDERWGESLSSLTDMTLLGIFDAVAIFDYFAATRGFSSDELQTIFESLVSPFRTSSISFVLYFKLVDDYGLVPSADHFNMLIHHTEYNSRFSALV